MPVAKFPDNANVKLRVCEFQKKTRRLEARGAASQPYRLKTCKP